MPMPHEQRKLPQRCAIHPKTNAQPFFSNGKFVVAPEPTFQPDQGKFITDHHKGTRFMCFDCLNKKASGQTKRLLKSRSPAQHDVFVEFARAGIKFVPEYRIGRWPFDMAFPDLRLFIEIDDPTHDTARGKKRDFYKTKLAEEHGWAIKRVRKGPDLVPRTLQALKDHREAIGA